MNHLSVEAMYSALTTKHSDSRTFTFRKDASLWRIELPEYVEKGGDGEDLNLNAGAKDLLSFLSWGRNHVTVTMDIQPFDQSVALQLVQLCDAPKGGGYYFLRNYRGVEVNKLMWLHDLPLFIFGDIPECIYIRKETQLSVAA